ncbi:hypothetical protein [Deinococcus cellulosilyticus]|uniref:Uncharacterized protein n=1 Tax=Deinococcus cellulosilyticus (strain DSM 18568 / NBRC 106333 / KACC 11606 / 5516J-15) TaxID=1223518 RepID=A0A511N7B1_DEIC1|nr:hypothetical protein [Deinococcus cellulosilyticus]GEM48724.1 hypothetical protein DC3_43590 [Deinococcus cellulosilyticus NBRC 106333 = KACC 11606]
MSIAAYQRVKSHSRQKGSRLLCLLILADRARDNGTGIFVDDYSQFVRDVARDMRMTPKQTSNILKELLETDELKKLELPEAKLEFQIVFPRTRYTGRESAPVRHKTTKNAGQDNRNHPVTSEKRFPGTVEKISGKSFPEMQEKISQNGEKPSTRAAEKTASEIQFFASENFSCIYKNINNNTNTLVGREVEEATHPPTSLPSPEVPPQGQPAKPTHDDRLRFFVNLMGYGKASHYEAHLERWDTQYSREFISLAWRLAPAHKHPRVGYPRPEFLFVDWLNRHKDCPWPDALQRQYALDLAKEFPADTVPGAPASAPKTSPEAALVVGQRYLVQGKEAVLSDLGPTSAYVCFECDDGDFIDVRKVDVPNVVRPFQHGGMA